MLNPSFMSCVYLPKPLKKRDLLLAFVSAHSTGLERIVDLEPSRVAVLICSALACFLFCRWSKMADLQKARHTLLVLPYLPSGVML